MDASGKERIRKINTKSLLSFNLHNFISEPDSVLNSMDLSLSEHITYFSPKPENEDNMRNSLNL